MRQVSLGVSSVNKMKFYRLIINDTCKNLISVNTCSGISACLLHKETMLLYCVYKCQFKEKFVYKGKVLHSARYSLAIKYYSSAVNKF